MASAISNDPILFLKSSSRLKSGIRSVIRSKGDMRQANPTDGQEDFNFLIPVKKNCCVKLDGPGRALDSKATDKILDGFHLVLTEIVL